MERIDATYAYDTPTHSVAIAPLSILSVINSEVGNTQPSTTTTIGFFTRDPIEYEGSEWNVYESLESRPLDSIDWNGMLSSRDFANGMLAFLDQFSPRVGVRQCYRVKRN